MSQLLGIPGVIPAIIVIQEEDDTEISELKKRVDKCIWKRKAEKWTSNLEGTWYVRAMTDIKYEEVKICCVSKHTVKILFQDPIWLNLDWLHGRSNNDIWYKITELRLSKRIPVFLSLSSLTPNKTGFVFERTR